MPRYRLTGLGVGSVSASWERADDDREIARRVLNELEDRRMLWRDFSMEIESTASTPRPRRASNLPSTSTIPRSVMNWHLV